MSPVPCSFQTPYIHFEFGLLRFIMFIFQPSLHFLFVLVFSFIPNDTGVTAEERCYSTELNSGKSFHYLILSYLCSGPSEASSDKWPETGNGGGGGYHELSEGHGHSHTQLQSCASAEPTYNRVCASRGPGSGPGVHPPSLIIAHFGVPMPSPHATHALSALTPNSKKNRERERDRGVIR